MYHEYKKREKEWNRTIKRLANCPHFVQLIEVMVDTHLNQVQSHRKLIQQWLSLLEYPNKDEVAHVAKTFITNENKIDDLDDMIYSMRETANSTNQSLSTLIKAMQHMKLVLEEEHVKNKKNRINHLRDELNEVKSLFN
jgi:hypothetical protein